MWMLQSANTTYKVQDLTKEHAEALRQRFRFVLLGATATSKWFCAQSCECPTDRLVNRCREREAVHEAGEEAEAKVSAQLWLPQEDPPSRAQLGPEGSDESQGMPHARGGSVLEVSHSKIPITTSHFNCLPSTEATYINQQSILSMHFPNVMYDCPNGPHVFS